MSLMAGTDLNLKATVDANVDPFDRAFAQAQRSVDRTSLSIERAHREIVKLEKELDDQATKALQRHHDALDKTGKAMFTFGAATAFALGLATREAIRWESAWAGVTKTTSGSTQQMDILEDQLRGLTRVLPSTHEEIAAVAEAAGQLGVARQDIADFTKTAIDLGNTTDIAAEDAATSLAQLMNIMESTPDLVTRIGNTLVALGNNGASTESQIVSMALRTAGAGKLIGATEADVLALSSAMANLGIPAELGGGAMQRVMLVIYDAVKKGGGALDEFARISGMSAQEFAQQWEADPVRAFNNVLSGLGQVKDQGGNVIQVLSDLGIKGTQNLNVMLRLAGAGDMLSESLDQSKDAWEKNNALIIEAEKRYATTEAQIAMARNQLRDSAIDIGNLVLPALSAIVGAGADIGRTWQDLPGPLRDVLVVLGLVAGTIGLVGGAAMIAIPKIAAFKTAVDQLEAGALKSAGTRLGGIASMLAGPWGLAIAGGITALGIFAAKHGEAIADIEALTATLDKQTGALTENSTQWVINKLSDEGILAGAKELGINLGTVTDAALGNRTAIAALNAEYERIAATLPTVSRTVNGQTFTAIDPYSPEALALAKLKHALEDVGITLGKSKEKWELENQAMAESAAGADAAAGKQQGVTTAWEEGADAARALTEEIKTLGEELADLAGDYLSNRDAARQVRDSLRGIREAARDYRKEHGDLDGAFKVGTKSGDAFQGMLDGLTGDYLRQIETTEKLTGSEKAVQRVYDDARENLIKVAMQLGRTRKQAEDYVDTVLGTPEVVESHWVTIGLDDANQKAKTYADRLRALDGMTATVFVHQVNTGNKLAGMAGDGLGPSAPHVGPSRGDHGRGLPPGSHGRTSERVGRGLAINNGRVQQPRPIVIQPSAASPEIDYDRLGRAVARAAPMYGDVYVSDGWGGFKDQMMRDRAAAGLDGVAQ